MSVFRWSRLPLGGDIGYCASFTKLWWWLRAVYVWELYNGVNLQDNHIPVVSKNYTCERWEGLYYSQEIQIDLGRNLRTPALNRVKSLHAVCTPTEYRNPCIFLMFSLIIHRCKQFDRLLRKRNAQQANTKYNKVGQPNSSKFCHKIGIQLSQ